MFKISLMESLSAATQKQSAQLSNVASPWRQDVKFVMSIFNDTLIYMQTNVILKV